MRSIPNLLMERQSFGRVAGVDEAGRGPLAGPVVAAAVVLDQAAIPDGINDSKKLTARRREELFLALRKTAHIGVGKAAPEEIDALNILEATKLAMRRAVAALPFAPDTVLVDGNHDIGAPPRHNVHTVVKGDEKSLSIAAASIIAKVTRDRIMLQLHGGYPHYGWDRNAGYGTREHMEALEKFGPTEFHRKSFAPVGKFFLTDTRP